MNFRKALKNPKPYLVIGLKRVIDFYRSFFYRGKQVYCEICNWQGTQFFDGKCPKCNSLPRTRLIPFALGYFELIKPKAKILHIAPNSHEYKYIRRTFPELSIYDRLNIRNVKYINIVQDLTQTNLESNQYDLAIAWHVLEHIPADIKAIKEVYRLLKPKGHFLVSVPIYPKGNAKTFEDSKLPYKVFEKVHGHYDHCRSCGLDYYQRFEDCGFKTNTLFVNEFDDKKKKYFGLRTDHVVWCFTK